MKLLVGAVTKYLCGLILLGLLLFLPAGTPAWTGGWLFLGLLFIPMLILGVFLYFRAPSLLEKRLSNKESEKTQKGVVAWAGLMFLVGFVLAGLDYRFGWSDLPRWLIIAASAVFLLSYGMYAEVMRENAYLSRTIEVQEGQKVIDTGLYGIVRHPMYTATVFLFLAMPLVLGSWVAFAVFLLYPVMIAVRIRNEEQVLRQGLPGYEEYLKKVRYRLIPFLW